MNKLSLLEKGRQSALVVVLTLILFHRRPRQQQTIGRTYMTSAVLPNPSSRPRMEDLSQQVGFIYDLGLYRFSSGKAGRLEAWLGRGPIAVLGIMYPGFQTTLDGGYIIAGETYPDTYHAYLWVLKLDKEGNGQWQKTYGTAVPILFFRLPMEVTSRRRHLFFRDR